MSQDDHFEWLENRVAWVPNDLLAIRQLVTQLEFSQNSGGPKGAFGAAQQCIRNGSVPDWKADLLSLPRFQEAYCKWMGILNSSQIRRSVPIAQLFTGRAEFSIKGQNASCKDRLKFFEDTKVISKLCHDCYKVQVLAKNLDAMVQAHFLLLKLDLPADNVRKCMIEIRDNIKNPYKGYIYCESISEAKVCLAALKALQVEHNVQGLVLKITHGCSEYALEYPDFKYSEDNGDHDFKTPDTWASIEQEYFNGQDFGTPSNRSRNRVDLSLRDIFVFRTWVKYAELIGDSTSAKYTNLGGPELPLHFVKRISLQASKRNAELKELASAV